MTSVTVPDADTVLWDKTASQIQTSVAISGKTVSGTSKHIADWSSAGFDPAKGTNFVALHVKGTDLDGTTTGVTCVCECVPSQGTPTPAFNDDDVVMQITSETTGIKVTVSKAGDVSSVTTYDISGMTLETE